MKVLIREMPATTTLALHALVETGSATEGEYLGSGISHFLEHMLFKGTQKRKLGEVAGDIQALGGRFNASTSYDFTIYTMEMPQGMIPQTLEIMADVLMHSVFDPREIEKEREVVFGEMRLHKDNPDYYISHLIFQNAYLRHPYRHWIIGYEPLLRELKQKDFVNYYRRHYIPNNMILSIAGKVKAEEILPLVQGMFKDFQRQRYPIRNLPAEPPQISLRRYEESYPTDITRMSLAFGSVSILHPDLFALDVLAMNLGQGRTSRLYRELYENQQLVHSIGASHYTPFDRGFFEIECQLDYSQVEPTLKAIWQEIQKVQREGVTPEELAKVKKKVLSEFVFDQQRPARVAWDQAVNEYYTGDANFDERYVDGIRRVTHEDIKRVALEYLKESNLNLIILKPEEVPSKEASQTEVVEEAPIQKFVFDASTDLNNGLTVLLREDHTLPLVAIQLAFRGGVRQEPEDKSGLSELTSRLWIKGTQFKTAQEVFEAVESRGGYLGSFSGRNSMGLSMQWLSEDVDYGLELLIELILFPAFAESEFAKVRDQMEKDIIRQQDSIWDVGKKTLRETLFQSYPNRVDPLGSLESLKRIEPADAAAFYRQLTWPHQAVLAVFGDIRPDTVLTQLKSLLAPWQKHEVILKTYSEPPLEKQLKKTIQMDKEEALLLIGFQGPKLGDPDVYGMEVISSLLGASLNGRIFVKIRDELGASYALGSGFSPGVEVGLFFIYVMTIEEHIDQVKDIIFSLVQEIQNRDVPGKELQDNLTYLKGTFQMGIQTNAALASVTSLDELLGLGYEYYRHYPERIDHVSKEEIRRLARQYLNPDKAAIIVTLPAKK